MKLFSLILTCLLSWSALAGSITTNNTIFSLSVADYGAQGDAVQFFVNTTSNSVLVTSTNRLPSSSIGDAIEIFQAGNQTYGANSSGAVTNGNQDLIATITNVVNGTNIFISLPAQNTLVNAFATFGHDNRSNFQAAIDAASSNTVINIPEGTYLILGITNRWLAYSFGIVLNKGGITLNGAGTNSTFLLSQGAWTMQGGGVRRSFLIEENPPIANNFPVVLENMTLDGGVEQGNSPFHGYPANVVDGQGWDGTHDAFLVWSYNSANAIDQMTWSNVVFQHWRGEMVKSIDGSTNGNLYAVNCVFNDGNATAINIYPSINFTNCYFNNLFQVAEYYQAYSTNVSYFQGNICTNITGNTFAINGGKGNNPPFIISGNTFCPSRSANGIETVPADNVVISNNLFLCQDYSAAVSLGCQGYQGTFDNSNILITANIIVNPYIFVCISGASWEGSIQKVESVTVMQNILRSPNHNVYLLLTYGWTTNIFFYSNDCSQFTTNISGGTVAVNSGNDFSPYAYVGTNNIYWTEMQDTVGATNYLSYTNGSRFKIIKPYNTKSIYALTDSDSNQIPVGAQILLQNNNSSAAAVPVYLNNARTKGPITVAEGQGVTFCWNGSAWTTNSVMLTVNSGSGSNAYAGGSILTVTAAAIDGMKFAYWIGATNILANPLAATTTATLPSAGNVSITAIYVSTQLLPPPTSLHVNQ